MDRGIGTSLRHGSKPVPRYERKSTALITAFAVQLSYCLLLLLGSLCLVMRMPSWKLVAAGDESRSRVPAEILPCPVHQDGEAIAIADQINKVDE